MKQLPPQTTQTWDEVMDSRLITAATLAACSGILYSYEHVESNEKFSPVNGRIVGWDMGNARKVQPRNSLCLCGSNKKAKKCCVWMPLSNVP